MKKVFVTVLFICFCTVLSWAYAPLLHQDNLWYVLNSYLDKVPASKITYETTQYKLGPSSADTVINGIVYQRLMASSDKEHNVWNTACFLREDVDNKRVFSYDKRAQHEVLMYDFSMEKGDTFHLYDALYFVDSCDSILCSDGVKHKRLNIKKGIVEENEHGDTIWHKLPEGDSLPYIEDETAIVPFWIEGVGSSFGIMRSGEQPSGIRADNLTCLYNLDQIIYKAENRDECEMWSEKELSEDVSFKEKNVSCFVNRESKVLEIVSNVESTYNVVIVDMYGRTLIDSDFHSDTQISLTSLPVGVYIVIVMDGATVIEHFKTVL